LSKYRTDIDGLRAVAVLCVIGFHVFPKQFPGGFVGVDIFFVISGFLITLVICHDLRAGTFSLANFYARRVRRIFPALSVVLLACVIVGWFVLFQDEFQSLGRNVLTAAAFVANFAVLQDNGYFNPSADLNPLLHLWSLGIEEQYYLIWPMLLVLSWRRDYAPLAIIGILFASSFTGNIVLIRTDTTAAFYLPVTRFWELMLGCGLSFLTSPGMQAVATPDPGRSGLRKLYTRHANVVHESAAWLGLGLVTSALLLISPNGAFPGWWALLPTLGAALMIFAGPTTSINRTFLSHPAVVYIGLISYALYLWHWPILVFERIVRAKEPTALMKLAGVGVAFFLADQTFRLIERQVRFGAMPRRKAIAASIALAAAGCIGLLIYAQNGFPERIPEDVRVLSQDIHDGPTAYQPDCSLSAEQPVVSLDGCDQSEPARPTIILWGDSHAAQLYPGLKALTRIRDGLTFATYAASGCPPIFSFTSEARKGCRSINDLVGRQIEQLRPHTVVMAARWQLYDGRDIWGHVTEDLISATVARLAAIDVKRIVVMGQFPIWEASVPRIRMTRFRNSIVRARSGSSERAFPQAFVNAQNWDRMVRHAIAGTGATFVSPLATFCNNDGCLLALPENGRSVAWDNCHLTVAASEFFVAANAPLLVGDH